MKKNKFSKFKQIDQIKRLRGTFVTRHESTRLDANERISPFNNKFIEKIKKKLILITLLLTQKQKKFMTYWQRNLI